MIKLEIKSIYIEKSKQQIRPEIYYYLQAKLL